MRRRRRRPLPKALAVDEAVQLADLHDADADPWAEARDRAIVELLYGCGLRVGELDGPGRARQQRRRAAGSTWTPREANVLGKGSKRRIVPVGAQGARGAARLAGGARRLCGARAARLRDPQSAAALFIGRNGTRFSAQSGLEAAARGAA